MSKEPAPQPAEHARGPLEVLRRGLWAWRNRKRWDHLVIHRRGLTTRLPPYVTLPVLCGHVKGNLRCPPDMTIVLIHNREREPIMERSLRYVGIDDHVTLQVKLNREWCHTFKLTALLNYLDSGSCDTDYLFYCDADDVVLRDDPQKAIRYLQESDCDWLFSFDEFSEGYQCMPRVEAWADRKAEESGHPHRYINAGVWIARTAFVHEVLRVARAYITDHDLTVGERHRLIGEGTLCQELPDFPKGLASDQILLRYLHPQFYPRMKIDYEGKLSLPRWAPSTPHGW